MDPTPRGSPHGRAAAAAGPRGGVAGRPLVVQQMPPSLPSLPYAVAPPYPLYTQPPALLPTSLPILPYPYPSPAHLLYPWTQPLPAFPPPHLPFHTYPQPHHTALQQPTDNSQIQEYAPFDEVVRSPWKQPVTQSDKELCERVSGEVCEEVVESALPDMVREVVNATVDDIIFSYIGQQWAMGRVPRPPSQPEPVRLTLNTSHLAAERPHSHPAGSSEEMRRGRGREHRPLPSLRASERGKGRRPSLQGTLRAGEEEEVAEGCTVESLPVEMEKGILLCTNNEEVSQLLSHLLLDELLFSQLLTTLLDGGVTMATRTQTIHLLNAMVFEDLLKKLLSSSH